MTNDEISEFFDKINIAKHGQDSENRDLYFQLSYADFSEKRDDGVCSTMNSIRLDSNSRQILATLERYSWMTHKGLQMNQVPELIRLDFVKKIRGQRSQISKNYPGIRKARSEVAKAKREREAIDALRTAVFKSMRVLSSDDMFRIVNECFVTSVMCQ